MRVPARIAPAWTGASGMPYGRRLVLVPRETPFSALHLESMLKLARLGCAIIPHSPGFYHRPESIQDLVDFVVARILDNFGVECALVARWGEQPAR